MGNLSPEIITIETADQLRLPGMFFAAEGKVAAIFLHGTGGSSVFYSADRQLPLAEALQEVGVSYLAFNNRGAHPVQRLHQGKEKVNFGSAYEQIEDCVADIEAAMAWLRQRGYEDVYLIGHSSGANKICVYDYLTVVPAARGYVLLGGGDDTGLYYQQFGRERFHSLLKKAKEKVEGGLGRELLREPELGEYLLSYQAFYDVANPDGLYNIFPFVAEATGEPKAAKPLFREFSGLQRPVLVVYGEQDEYCLRGGTYAVSVLERFAPAGDTSFSVLHDTDHGFTGKERILAETCAHWIAVQQAV